MMGKIITLMVEGDFDSEFHHPGSDVALAEGCICPIDQPQWPEIKFHEDCPVHLIETVEVKH